MAKLYFHYSTMNAGKTTGLLQAAFNYRERGMEVLLFTAALDNRFGTGQIASRIGLKETAHLFSASDDLFARISALCAAQETTHESAQESTQEIACIFFDEAQFLSYDQVWQLARVVDELKLPIMAYGIRTDFQGRLFPGCQALMAIADELREVKTICHCGRKATMVVRADAAGYAVTQGAQVEVGGNDRYIPLCRKHWRSAYEDGTMVEGIG